MFGSKKAAVLDKPVVEEVKNTIGPPIPIIEVAGDVQWIEEYSNLSDYIGFDSPALKFAKLKTLLANKNIPIYDIQHVIKYLMSKRTDVKYLVKWAPLRKGDMSHCCIPSIVYEPSTNSYSGRFHGHFDDGRLFPYEKAVPMSVLNTVKTIMDEFAEARFFVSDIKLVQDPFLAVGFDGTELLVVDFWDEPGFKPC